MLTSQQVRFGALTALMFVLGCSGADGAKGENGDTGVKGDTGATGDKGDTGAKGDPGDPASTNSAVQGTVTDNSGTPLAGVAVSLTPGTATTTTDATGAFKLSTVPVGVYDAEFKLANYVTQTVPIAVNMSGATKMTVKLAADLTVGAPTVTLSDQLAVGFGASVTVQAAATGGQGTLTYKWTQTGGPAVTLSGATTDKLTFTTWGLVPSMGPETFVDSTGATVPRVSFQGRMGALGVNPDQAGNYEFELAVTDADGRVTKSTAVVHAARPTTGLRNVPVGNPVYLQGDGDMVTPGKKTWAWSITGPSGYTSNLVDADKQFPHFTPTAKGVYTLTEGTKSFKVYAGNWLGTMSADHTPPSACSGCHDGGAAPDVWAVWKNTGHATALERKLNGASGPHFTRECLSCHTLGDDAFAANNGFDDNEGTSGWTYPTIPAAYDATSQNWANLVGNAKLGALSGIQCESCHGPQDTAPGTHNTSGPGKTDDTAARISWSSDVCASCHQEEPFHYKPEQWSAGGHANLELTYVDATVEARGATAAHCGRCHTAQGYARFVNQLKIGETGNLTTDGQIAKADKSNVFGTDTTLLTKWGLTQAQAQSQTCQTCHDPHDSTNPYQLRIYDTAPYGLPNGQGAISNAGTGIVCMTCHNSRNGEHSDFKFTPSFSASHKADQTDVMYGFNAFWMPRYTPSAHLAVTDSCAGCHVKIATGEQAASKQASNHSFRADESICTTCHASAVDGLALQAAYKNQLDGLGTLLGNKVMNLIKAELTANNGFTVRAWDPVTDYYSGAASTTANVTIQQVPTAIEHFEVHGQVGFILTLAAPQTIPFVTAAGAAAPSKSMNKIYVQAGTLSKINGTTPLFTNGSDYMKAAWNYWLLEHDGTKGVHNPSFYTQVIGVTSTKVNALP